MQKQKFYQELLKSTLVQLKNAEELDNFFLHVSRVIAKVGTRPGESIRVPYIGTFRLHEQRARRYLSPINKAILLSKPKRLITFTPAKMLRRNANLDEHYSRRVKPNNDNKGPIVSQGTVPKGIKPSLEE